jgi:hypothetical protein
MLAAKTVTLTWFTVFSILAVLALIIGAIIHGEPRARAPLFWLIVGTALFVLAFLLERLFG